MRSTIIAAAAFAATVMAVPYANPEVITAYETDVAYVTNVVTVTQGAPAPTTVAAAAEAPAEYGSSDDSGKGWHWPHKHRPHKSHKSKKTRTRTRTQAAPTPTETYEAPAPTTEAPAPTTEAPAPTTHKPKPKPKPKPTTEAPAPAPSAPSGLSGYNDIVVAHHNVHRANHSAPDLEWDDGLAATALKIAKSCVYAHDTEMDGGGYGQNIAAGVEGGNVSAVITDLFYNGEVGYYTNLYGQANPDMSNFEGWGHFSQIVWKETTHVGCATYDCSGQGLANTGSYVSPYFTVCNYKNPGNYAGEYKDNVLKPKEPCADTVGWNYGL